LFEEFSARPPEGSFKTKNKKVVSIVLKAWKIRRADFSKAFGMKVFQKAYPIPKVAEIVIRRFSNDRKNPSGGDNN